jgi:LmbE family N-acetylglucosaminyl deacetylase
MALNQPGSGEAEARYRDAYAGLVHDLSGLLAGFSDVFTHNPWGEYGHPDHVQVSRVVTTLGERLGFRTHFSNYVAPRSMRFASSFIPRLKKGVVLEPDRALADQVKGMYVENGCWTWHADYSPPETEAFLVNAERPPTEANSVPLNCLMTT